MKVLLFTNLYPSSREPTKGMYNLQSFQALARYCEARVVAPVRWWSRLRRPRELFTVPLEDATGLPAAYPTYWPVPGRPQSHVSAMRSGLRPYLRRLRREFPFDIILAAFAYPDGAAAACLAQDFGCPVVILVFGSDLNDLADRPALREEVRSKLQQAQRIIAVSAALRERTIELGIDPEKVVVQRNGVDGERFRLQDRQEVRARLGLPADRRLICTVGNVMHVKGQDVLIEAMGLLRGNEDPCADLALVGGGYMGAVEVVEKLQARVHELGLSERVRFLGRRPHEEVADWIGASDVYCLPSRNEGCPNVVLEALACGRPVVASNVGGVPELLNAGNGILVPAEDPAALADGLRQALNRSWDPEALRNSVECLSWDQVGQGYFHVLQAALQEFKRPAAAPARS
ncbi:MAG TPA: glycosyltransferase family 4 protein [Chthonomonadaceae bacterium]|nr:glycosyltransferase family 4 protein [Chthonomonadaceae bacterium]